MIVAVIFVINCIILNNVDQISALVELPQVEDNNIIKAENTIRNTTNTLFKILKFHGKKGNPNLKRLSLIHSYLVTLTLKDYSSLTEVAKLTRVANINDFNVSQHFIEILNEIVNDNATDSKIDDEEDDIVSVVSNYIHNLAYITHFYSTHSPQVDLKNEVVKYFDEKVDDKDKEDGNSTQVDDDNEGGLQTWKPDTRRIYQGKRTKIKHFPFMASVEIFGKFTCGGSIIGDDLVITAASCLQLAWNNRFYRENPAFLSVRIGSTFFESGGEKVEVLEVYFHPSYDPGALRNNVAVMRLRRKIKFSRKNRKKVMKIEFDRNDHRLSENTDGITVVGWGAKTSSNVIHNAWEQRLSYDLLSVYGLNECQDVYSKTYVTGKHFCAGFISKGGGACNRDVGGPGVVDGILTGIISFGSPVCGANDSPTVFTKVGFYADWIEDIIDQPVITGKQKTTTEKTFNYDYAWEHLHPTEGKATLIYSTKYSVVTTSEEKTTTEGRMSEKDIQRIINNILRKDKKKDFSSSSEELENILKTVQKTTPHPLQQKIMNLLRESRKAEDATEYYMPSTMITGNVDPIALFNSEDDDDEYQEHTKKVTVIAADPKKSSPQLQLQNKVHKDRIVDKTLRQEPKFSKNDLREKYQNDIHAKLQNDEEILRINIDSNDKQRKSRPNVIIVNEDPSEKPIKVKSLKPDDVILALLYASDKDMKENEKLAKESKDSDTISSTDTDSDKNNSIFGKNSTNPSSDSSFSDSEDTGKESLSILDKRKKFSFSNNSNITLQSILSDADLYEILSEALREDLNFTVPEPTTSQPQQRSKLTI